jgi:putative hydrolase of the HAD superfamily
MDAPGSGSGRPASTDAVDRLAPVRPLPSGTAAWRRQRVERRGLGRPGDAEARSAAQWQRCSLRLEDHGVTEVGFRGVLFDSGDTLIRPVGGRWNPRYDFEEIVLRHLPGLAPEAFPEAFAAGQQVLDAGPTAPSLADYHRAILHALGVRRPPPRLLWELEQPGARLPVEPFPEVPAVLERLRAGGVGMAVVSDNWPGLEGLYRRLGLEAYFQAFVISAVLGCTKPDPRMYRAGSDALGLAPHECLVVDDAPDLVAAAIELGYGGTAIIRTADLPATVPWIGTLEDLLPMTGT